MLDKLPSPKYKSKSVRKGRGMGTGKGGHTVGRGMKGQKSRSGYSRPRPGFEGGQMPLSRRLPTLKGFSRGFRMGGVRRVIIHLGELAENFKSNSIVNTESLAASGLLDSPSKKLNVKILYDGDIKKKLTIEGLEVSKKAKEAIEKAGGKVS